MLTPLEIAKWFVCQRLKSPDKDAVDLTPKILQRLLYYAQAWYLAFHKMPLFTEDFYAEPSGPTLKSMLDRAIEDFQPENGEVVDESRDPIYSNQRLSGYLDEILLSYGRLNTTQLQQMLKHEKPWQTVLNHNRINPGDQEMIISKESMRLHYEEKYKSVLN